MTSFLPGARRGTWEGLNRASTFRSVTPDGSGHGHPAFTEGTRTSADLSPRHPRGATTMPEGTTLHVGNNGDTHAGDASGSSRMVVRLSRRVVESITFVLFTTLLTIFALIGDDIRILSTTKEFDFLYSVITMFCLVIFTIEIILSCLGKPDYLCGFFFNLDVVSTASLILDIQFLSEPLMAFINDMDGGENQGEASGNSQTGQMRSGRTARVGAKAGRVVRVIKLVRILKLYKAIYAARAAKRAKEDDDDSKADDDWGDMDEEEQRQDTGKASMQESQVGKKLSELTIRRVIVLVLTMLIAVPLLTQENVEEQFSSIYYGGGTVGQSFAAWRNSLLNATADHGLFHLNYQMALLTYASYHNWFKQLSMSSGLFWIGLRTAVAPSSSLFQEAVEAARLRTEVVDAWAAREPGEASAFPAHVRPLLSSTWGASCIEENAGRGVAGISLLSNGVSQIVSCPADLRTLEVTCFESSLLPINASVQAEAQSFSFYFCFDRRPLLKAEAGYGLAMTGFVCVVLVASATVFSHDANRIVVSPLEHMIKRVREIAADPLVAMKMADEEFKFEEMKKAKAKRHGSKGAFDAYIKPFFTGRSDGPPEAMETVILEKTIIKLGSLLALGFGQAGANIIGHNIASSHSAGVNVMIPGIRVDCIVGKIRIRDFSTATEVLQAHVMTFVNQIAEIVHGIVDECHGAANKNNGETFLVIWRLSDPSLAAVSRVADLSLLAFAKIHGAVHRSLTLSGYRGHPGLQQRLGVNMFMPQLFACGRTLICAGSCRYAKLRQRLGRESICNQVALST
eukprot:TRINITY_DN25819_c0_g2_i6.p1 TRINITY_DN25819_c0_g2~~TRINITY_DN25819_c0_g2_i6.p1  ORF type:complete len:797 (-),score=166.11 TRINITY_DN25819_c0_g2_i6:122-2512(-)